MTGTFRNLKCSNCQTVTGFTIADLDEVMAKDYRKNYHCDNCNEYTDQEWAGATFEFIDGERVFTELIFEETS
jgi:hypothetical protein